MGKMTFFEAAIKVLEDAGGGPLHYREIAKRALERAYISPKGQTPDASLGAALYTHKKRTEARGLEPRVKNVGSGKFSLFSKSKFGTLKIIEENNTRVRKELHEKILSIHPRAFEHLIGRLLAEIGFEDVLVTNYSGDGGLDIEAELTVGGVTNVKTAVQAKRWKGNVSGKTVRELRGGLMIDQRGLIITTSSFTKDALKEAETEGKTPISLIDGEKLLDLLIENDIAVSKKKVSYHEIDLEFFNELEQESEVSPSGKSLGLWPLPGGQYAYVDTAVSMLKYITQAEPDQNQMIKWMMKTFPQTKSEKTIASYIRVLKTMKLINFDGETIIPTESGTQALTADAKDVFRDQLRLCLGGVDEYLEELTKKSMTLEESHEFFKNTLSVDWETDYQTKMRLTWLENVGAIAKKDGKYSLI